VFLQIFPALFDWVSYPVTLMIKELYELEMKVIVIDRKPDPFRLELLASFERLLCFCHTGSTAVFATSLMRELGLSLGAITDGFPMLHHKIFNQPSILSAMKTGFSVDPRAWPMKNKYPAIASKRAQVLTYSLSHFMVSPIFIFHRWIVARNMACTYALLDVWRARLGSRKGPLIDGDLYAALTCRLSILFLVAGSAYR
jgi:hypothetical protein